VWFNLTKGNTTPYQVVKVHCYKPHTGETKQMADFSRSTSEKDNVAVSKLGSQRRLPNAKVSGRHMEINMDSVGIRAGSFELVSFRHLRKDVIARIKEGRFEKVVLVHDGRRKVLMANGGSVKPYYEDVAGNKLADSEEVI